MASESFSPELRDRDLRMLRGADVLSAYQLTRVDVDDITTEVTVHRGKRTYTVNVARDWSRAPTCTCPDSTRGRGRQQNLYCKHTVATLMRWEEFRCQLLDVMI